MKVMSCLSFTALLVKHDLLSTALELAELHRLAPVMTEEAQQETLRVAMEQLESSALYAPIMVDCCRAICDLCNSLQPPRVQPYLDRLYDGTALLIFYPMAIVCC